VERAEDYPWSSAAAHCGLRADPLVETPWPDDPLLPVDWAQWLRGEDALGVLFLRQATLVGRPCGSARFISQVETQLQRSVTPQKRGPKAKLKKSDDAHNVA
jgi:putative transposase